MKTEPKGYHKIVIPAQHWYIPVVHVPAISLGQKWQRTQVCKKNLSANERGEVACTQGENIKQAKGNECSQYKNIAEIFSSSLPICLIHIFSSDTQACFALVTSYNTACFALMFCTRNLT